MDSMTRRHHRRHSYEFVKRELFTGGSEERHGSYSKVKTNGNISN